MKRFHFFADKGKGKKRCKMLAGYRWSERLKAHCTPQLEQTTLFSKVTPPLKGTVTLLSSCSERMFVGSVRPGSGGAFVWGRFGNPSKLLVKDNLVTESQSSGRERKLLETSMGVSEVEGLSAEAGTRGSPLLPPCVVFDFIDTDVRGLSRYGLVSALDDAYLMISVHHAFYC